MKLASFETITEILPIEGADRIELARIQGWQSVIRKGEYKVGDQVIFVPIDTVIRPAVWNKFLWDKNDPTKPIRVRTVKLRGVVSQGLIFPTSLISAQEIWDHMDDPEEDVSIAGILGISKYEKLIPANLAGEVVGDFPSHILSKTDEDNLLSNIVALDELKEADEVICTIKYDGTSGTFIKELDNIIRVCSRNLELKNTESNVHWQMVRKYKLDEVVPSGHSLQFEIVGPSIQKNPIGLKDVQIFAFNFMNNSSREYLYLAEDNEYGIPVVQEIKRWSKDEFSKLSIDDLQKFANDLKYPNNQWAEGIVLRGYKSNKLMFSEHLRKMLSLKIISQNYFD